jgi:hypothetical protein
MLLSNGYVHATLPWWSAEAEYQYFARFDVCPSSEATRGPIKTTQASQRSEGKQIISMARIVFRFHLWFKVPSSCFCKAALRRKASNKNNPGSANPKFEMM